MCDTLAYSLDGTPQRYLSTILTPSSRLGIGQPCSESEPDSTGPSLPQSLNELQECLEPIRKVLLPAFKRYVLALPVLRVQLPVRQSLRRRRRVAIQVRKRSPRSALMDNADLRRWFVPQDPVGLVQLFGSNEYFASQLSEFFELSSMCYSTPSL